MPSFQVPVLGSLFVSFRPSQLRSHSCSTGASLLFRFLPSPSLPGFPLLFPLSFVRFFSGSDYSAFCSSFPLFPVSPLSGFPGARFRFRFFAFPFLSSLISHAFLPGFRTRLSVCFLSPFPDSLPTAVPQVLTLCFRFRSFCFPSAFFRPLLFRFRLLSSLFLPFPSSWPCLSVALPVLRFFLSASPFSALSSAWFPMLLFRFPVLGFLFVSFHPSRFRSHSRSTGASLLFRFLSSASFSGFSACFPLSFVRLSLLLTTQPSALSFPFFPFSPGSGSSGASFLFRPTCFHAVLPIPVLSFLRFLSPSAVSPHSGYLSASAFFLAVSGLFPLAFALGSGYSALGSHLLSDASRLLRIYHSRSQLAQTTM